MRNKIAVKLSLYFAAALLLLTLIVGILFIVLFRSYTVNEKKKDMAARAESIAATMSGYMNAGSLSMGNGSGAGKGAGGYGAYLKFIDDIAGTPVWLVDRELNLITNSMSGARYNFEDLPEDAGLVVTEVFQGRTTFSEGFSKLLDSPTLTVGTPIYTNGDIVGAVLLHSSVQGITESANKGIAVLALSLAAALAVTVLMSAFLAARIAKPLKKMTASTAQLADGDYTVKTTITGNDEIGMLARSIDILSDRLGEASRAADQLDGLRRDFVANVSHELRTPITVLRGSLEALCDGVVTEPEQIRLYYSRMLTEILSLQRLVNDLMELSRLQNMDFNIEAAELNLVDVLQDAVRSAGQLAAGKQIAVLLRTDTHALFYSGDYGRLRQMFMIILDNAVKFSPAGTEVLVTLKNRTVAVRDQGPGISPEDRPYIFDRFHKTRSEDNVTGSGLGLAIAKQIAERHHIGLSLNDRYDAGAEFIFNLDP
jgi:signal transduction histidine kinase